MALTSLITMLVVKRVFWQKLTSAFTTFAPTQAAGDEVWAPSGDRGPDITLSKRSAAAFR
ncbi:ORF1195 [White spot syndrome virus]|uniref:ORF1195 n=1 Tax=White spot syndrome virus TaxID=342409 RepID=A0A2D3I791_9VIRU|nr:ORF1195 [White spot syndrome virus]